eukprot:768673-Hanusia_phi.AAC.2
MRVRAKRARNRLLHVPGQLPQLLVRARVPRLVGSWEAGGLEVGDQLRLPDAVEDVAHVVFHILQLSDEVYDGAASVGEEEVVLGDPVHLEDSRVQLALVLRPSLEADDVLSSEARKNCHQVSAHRPPDGFPHK